MYLLLLFICVCCSIENNPHKPRMVFTDKESAAKRFLLTKQDPPVRILVDSESDVVTSVGKTKVYFYNFSNTAQVPEGQKVIWKFCNKYCNYNVTLVHQREKEKPLFVCGTNGKITECCDMHNLSSKSPECIQNAKIEFIQEFVIKEGEQSALVETEKSTDLYITCSGAHENVGIHKFGSKRVRPANHDEEQYYLGLVLSRRANETLESKVYAFYKQRNKDTGLGSDMWLPFVSRVCMDDAGGPKSNLQFSWTSLLSARLYCGDLGSKKHFSELVDVTTVQADKWPDTRVYALFRNVWGVSAVCVYTIGDIENTFTKSPFIGSVEDSGVDTQRKRCVPDSTKISADILKRIEKVSQMRDWVQPVNKSGPVLLNHQKYTRLNVDASLENGHTVMFLSLSNGAVHKAVKLKNHSFVIAEYQPLHSSAPILGLNFNPVSKTLYVNYEAELVQVNMQNCDQYGNTCQDCVLSGDPYCSWKSSRCGTETNGTFHHAVSRNHSICPKDKASTLPLFAKVSGSTEGKKGPRITVPFQSSYFLRCPMSSHHAQYTWNTPEGSRPCNLVEDQCIHLIDRMTPKQEGDYKCESMEMDFQTVVVEYQLKSTAGGRTFRPTFWVFVVTIFKSVSFYFLSL